MFSLVEQTHLISLKNVFMNILANYPPLPGGADMFSKLSNHASEYSS